MSDKVQKTTTKEPISSPVPVVTTNPVSAFVASSELNPWILAIRGLPRTIDDAERDFGADIYDKMLHDPVLAAAFRTLKMSVLEDGMIVAPSHDEPDERVAKPEELAQYQKAVEIADFVRRCLRNLSYTGRAWEDVLWEMLDALWKGHRLAEVTYCIAESGPDKGHMIIESIKPKPRKNYAFLLDQFNNFIGVIAVVPTVSIVIREGIIWNIEGIQNILDPRKVFRLSFGGKEGDPRGESMARPAYNPWYRKQVAQPEEVKFIAQFGGGMITGVVPKSTSQVVITREDGTQEEVTPEVALADTLSRLRNGGVAVVKEGGEINIHEPSSSGEAFSSFFSRCDREMVMAVLNSARTLLESNRNSQADAGQAENLLDTVRHYVRGVVCRCVENQLFRVLVSHRWDEDTALEFLPRAVMQKASKPDFSMNASAIASLYSCGYIDDSQKAAIDRDFLGLPERIEETEDDGEKRDEQDEEDEA